MEKKDLDTFKELFELIPQIIGVSKSCVEEEISIHQHDLNRLKMERKFIQEILGIIQGKWTIDIMYLIRVLGESQYSELKDALKGISSRILTDRLRLLERKKVVERLIHDTSPIRVSYKLTRYGSNLFHLMVPIFIFGLSHNKTHKSL
ncbi:MAG: hypothetical protein GF383_15470 [Candidatus Lokiarchaeota archaeon]|nr:hypothetical protein [Candidatus Lokiarchaeota archaeon]MBD3342949.1 hypothetical protein [Candidatus Lokiarchaeota archaeon]